MTPDAGQPYRRRPASPGRARHGGPRGPLGACAGRGGQGRGHQLAAARGASRPRHQPVRLGEHAPAEAGGSATISAADRRCISRASERCSPPESIGPPATRFSTFWPSASSRAIRRPATWCSTLPAAAAIRLAVEVLEVQLTDLGPAWSTPRRAAARPPLSAFDGDPPRYRRPWVSKRASRRSSPAKREVAEDVDATVRAIIDDVRKRGDDGAHRLYAKVRSA